MAALICRNLGRIARQPRFFAAARQYSDIPYIDPAKGKIGSDQLTMPDTMGHAVGVERFELLANLHGEEDPFEMNVKNKAHGTKEEPTIVSSIFHFRTVGCICEEDSLHINWMMVYKGEPKRCECGYWFKVVNLETKDYGQA